jgi:hypothetical protein
MGQLAPSQRSPGQSHPGSPKQSQSGSPELNHLIDPNQRPSNTGDHKRKPFGWLLLELGSFPRRSIKVQRLESVIAGGSVWVTPDGSPGAAGDTPRVS